MVSGRRNRQRRCSATTRLPRRPTTPWTTGSVLAVVLLPPGAHALKDLALGTDLPYNGQPLGIKPQIVADNSHHSSLKRSFLKVSKYLDRDVDAGRSRSDNDTVASSNRTINRYSAVMGLPFQSSHASTTSQSTSSPTHDRSKAIRSNQSSRRNVPPLRTYSKASRRSWSLSYRATMSGITHRHPTYPVSPPQVQMHIRISCAQHPSAFKSVSAGLVSEPP